MKSTATIVIILSFIYSFIVGKDYGSVIINPELNYEVNDSFEKHDNFQNIRYGDFLLEPTVSIEVFDDYLIIGNCLNDGLTGYQIKFKISKELKILDAVYDEWTDVIDGSKTINTVEEITLSLNTNPFANKYFEGRYEILIKQDFKAGEYLALDEIKDTITIKEFNGKFKIYNENELALKKHRLDSLNKSMENRKNMIPVVNKKLETGNLKKMTKNK
jgi:hypothetical protein